MKHYCLCENKCQVETLSKVQIEELVRGSQNVHFVQVGHSTWISPTAKTKRVFISFSDLGINHTFTTPPAVQITSETIEPVIFWIDSTSPTTNGFWLYAMPVKAVDESAEWTGAVDIKVLVLW